MANKSTLPHVDVKFIDPENGIEQNVIVQTDARDNFAFSMIRRSTKDIPTMKEDALLWTSILVWHALKREELIPKTIRWDEFCSQNLIDLSPVDEEEPTSDPLAIQ